MLETLDSIKGLKLIQRRDGYRVNMDALLLADFIKLGVGDRILDLGTGSGIIALILGQRDSVKEIIGLEIQPGLSELARRNISLNNLDNKIKVIEGDLRKISSLFKSGEFDGVCSNPPYRRIGSGRINPREEKAIARHEVLSALSDILFACKYSVRPGGKVFLVYLAERLTHLLYEMRSYELEPKRLRLIYPDTQSSASLLLVEAIRDGQPGLEVLPPLFVREETGQYTPEAAQILGNGLD
jgi:tRNA1Val (adenine37-N6)-methyltransferase